MRFDVIRVGNHPPEDINVIVEVPVGGEPIKYEVDKASGALVVDRFLYTPMRYPGKWVKIVRRDDAAGARAIVLEAMRRA